MLSKTASKGGNEFKFEKNREEIQSVKNSDELSTVLWFMDIFPIFDEFFTIFPFNFMQNSEKKILCNFLLEMEKFQALCAIWKMPWTF